MQVEGLSRGPGPSRHREGPCYGFFGREGGGRRTHPPPPPPSAVEAARAAKQRRHPIFSAFAAHRHRSDERMSVARTSNYALARCRCDRGAIAQEMVHVRCIFRRHTSTSTRDVTAAAGGWEKRPGPGEWEGGGWPDPPSLCRDGPGPRDNPSNLSTPHSHPLVLRHQPSHSCRCVRSAPPPLLCCIVHPPTCGSVKAFLVAAPC